MNAINQLIRAKQLEILAIEDRMKLTVSEEHYLRLNKEKEKLEEELVALWQKAV